MPLRRSLLVLLPMLCIVLNTAACEITIDGVKLYFYPSRPPASPSDVATAPSSSSNPNGSIGSSSPSPRTVPGDDCPLAQTASGPFRTCQAASVVIGQATMTSNGDKAHAFRGTTFSNVVGRPVFADGFLYVATSDANIYAFAGVPQTNGATALFTWGAPATYDAHALWGATRNIASDGERFVEIDNGLTGARVLLYDAYPTDSVVYGAHVLLTNGPLGTTDVNPYGLDDAAISGNVLVVSNGYFSEVMLWRSLPAGDQSPPSPEVTLTMTIPGTVWTDGQRLVVTDWLGATVQIWKSLPTTSNAKPDTTLGGFSGLPAATSDGNMLVVVDQAGNRVFVWNRIPTAPQTPPDALLGAPDPATVLPCSVTATTLCHPSDATIVGGNILIDDAGNNRVLIFDAAR